MINRRQLLAGSASVTLAWPLRPVMANSDRDPRLVFMILRGGLDGLAAVPAFGDANYRSARGGLAIAAPGEPSGALDLDGFFGLHPVLAGLHGLYRARELLVAHAVAPPYRKRSHFDGQDVLETGLEDPSATSDGWLYRALSLLSADRLPEQRAVALGGAIPRVLRGALPVGSWAPDVLPEPDGDTLQRVLALYQADPILGPALNSGLEAEAILGQGPGEMASDRRGSGELAVSVKAAAGFLSHAEGPRIAVLESGGWDTHANQQGQLGNRLSSLDQALALLKSELGTHWQRTVLVVATEFGRTVAMNGTRGSDHGVGGVAFVAGGAVAGGRVLGDWPGLRDKDLYQGRDLRPTMDVRSLFKSVLVGHLGLAADAVDEKVFAGVGLPLMGDLIRA